MARLKLIQLDSGTIEEMEEGYVRIVFSDYPQITLEEVKKREQAILDICKGRSMPFLIDTRSKLIEYSAEARDYMANHSKLTDVRNAEVFIINNIGLNILVNDYVKKNPVKCPVKIFKKEEDALSWIAEFVAS